MTEHGITPTDAANTAADALRTLNRATLDPGPGWRCPGDAYNVAAALTLTVQRVPQICDQIDVLITALHTRGSLISVTDDLPDRTHTLHTALDQATEAAETLTDALDTAHTTLGHLATE